YQRVTGMRVPFQRVREQMEPAKAERTLTDEGEVDVTRLLEDSAAGVLDPENGPVLGASLLKQGLERHLLVLTVLPVTADPASLAIVATDLARAYGGGAGASEEPLQYADFAEWQHESLSSKEPDARRAAEHWGAWADTGPAPVVLPFERTAGDAGGAWPASVMVPVTEAT